MNATPGTHGKAVIAAFMTNCLTKSVRLIRLFGCF